MTDTPAHLFAGDDGALYDTRRQDWAEARPLRPLWRRHCGTTVFVDPSLRAHAFKAALRAGAYAWPGGYPLAVAMHDGASLCFDCARAEARQILQACRDARLRPGSADRDWLPGWVEIQEEYHGETCAHCGKELETAYGPD